MLTQFKTKEMYLKSLFELKYDNAFRNFIQIAH